METSDRQSQRKWPAAIWLFAMPCTSVGGIYHPLQAEEFERFLGEKSKELVDRLEEAKDVMKRLKDRG